MCKVSIRNQNEHGEESVTTGRLASLCREAPWMELEVCSCRDTSVSWRGDDSGVVMLGRACVLRGRQQWGDYAGEIVCAKAGI